MGSSDPSPAVGAFHHVGILVADLGQAKRLFVDLLGFEIASEASLEDLGLDVAFVQAGAVQIELIRIRDANLRGERLGGATARLDHVAFEVEAIGAAAARLAAAGVDTAAGVGPNAPRGEILRTPAANNVFSLPATSLDLLFQFLEPIDRDSATNAGERPGRDDHDSG